MSRTPSININNMNTVRQKSPFPQPSPLCPNSMHDAAKDVWQLFLFPVMSCKIVTRNKLKLVILC